LIPKISFLPSNATVAGVTNTLTLALSPQGRGDLKIAPPLRGGVGEGV